MLFKTKRKKLDFVLIGKLLKPELDDFSDNALEFIGQHDVKNEVLALKSKKLSSETLHAEGNAFADMKNDKLPGLVKYKTDYVGDLVE